jgi:hypothetical protein
MINNQSLILRAKNIFREDGLKGLIYKGLTFPARLLASFKFRKFYIYEHDIIERKEADFYPRIPSLTFYIVTSNRGGEELASQGLNIYSISRETHQWLDKGAIAFCFFSGRKLCHIGWLALNEEAKNTFEPWPYRVNFPQEACTGGTQTVPEFEGKGLMTYGYYRRFEYLRLNGIKKSRNIVETSNLASQKVHEKFSPRKSRGYYLRFGYWQFWKERQLEKRKIPVKERTIQVSARSG